ncbi:MAG TPA: apolipoprotein N-acyltransferase [Cytophagaceae bacterium]|jgi:apolipoprotein N-acyltransferase|nr:apolipoprotein N-acyltransferase [Cytophagaceae bacterium]
MKTVPSNQRLLFFSLSVLSSLLLYLAWPVMPFFPLILVAFTPLFWINEQLGNDRLRLGAFILYIYTTLALFNIFTTWWVWNSTPPGAVFAMLVNALLMLIPWLAYRVTTYRLKFVWWSHFSIVLYFIAFEYWHLNWELSWPWLTLGNSAALFPEMVQWYEYTGVLGGSFWILTTNVLVFLCYSCYVKKQPRHKALFYLTLSVALIPVLFSFLRYLTYKEEGKGKEVVVIQPNIDPYTQKYPGTKNFISYAEQYQRLESMSKDAIGSSTDFVLWPETSFPADILEEDDSQKVVANNVMLRNLVLFTQHYPRTAFLVGADSYHFFPSAETADGMAYPTQDPKVFYTPYNTGLFITKGQAPVFYHKSKLVPGVEVLPYPKIFGFVTQSLGDLVVASVGKQKQRTVLKTADHTAVSPVICYESIYGEFLGEYVKNGAGLFFIITNDAWWGNTAGHVQHFHYARLRAIEHRKCVARAANTGISGFINQRGDIISQSHYDEQRAMRQVLLYNPTSTLYSLLGDAMGIFAVVGSLVFLVLGITGKKIIHD